MEILLLLISGAVAARPAYAVGRSMLDAIMTEQPSSAFPFESVLPLRGRWLRLLLMSPALVLVVGLVFFSLMTITALFLMGLIALAMLAWAHLGPGNA